jgi:hypothetical protein
MKNLIQRRWAMGAAVFVLTAASYAQCSRLSRRRPAQGNQAAAHPAWRPAHRRALRLSLAGSRLPAGRPDRQRTLPVALQLPLRPLTRPHQSAQLL